MDGLWVCVRAIQTVAFLVVCMKKTKGRRKRKIVALFVTKCHEEFVIFVIIFSVQNESVTYVS